jgi:hypothetical protein
MLPCQPNAARVQGCSNAPPAALTQPLSLQIRHCCLESLRHWYVRIYSVNVSEGNRHKIHICWCRAYDDSRCTTTKTMKTIEELHAEVKEEFERCKVVKEGLDRRRRRRNRVSRKSIALQDFCAKMSKLIESFPGVNDAARAGDQRIGGGLVACLSLLFQVLLNNLKDFEQSLTYIIDRTKQEWTRGGYHRCY